MRGALLAITEADLRGHSPPVEGISLEDFADLVFGAEETEPGTVELQLDNGDVAVIDLTDDLVDMLAVDAPPVPQDLMAPPPSPLPPRPPRIKKRKKKTAARRVFPSSLSPRRKKQLRLMR